jgi:peptidoglycan/LPS O-acetylase OafA/YrhL
MEGAMEAAHQQQHDLNFPAINRLHMPVAYLAMLLLLGVIALASRYDRLAYLRQLAITVALALLANAFVCGALSNPHDRYGARMAWLAVLVVLLVPWTIIPSSRSGGSRSGAKVTPSEIRPAHLI